MILNRLLAGTAVATTTLVLAAVPANAASTGPPAATADRASNGTLDPAPSGMIDAVRRDLGLTREQAATRLGNEEKARQLQPILRDRLGDRYAGSWVNRDGTLVVATTDPAARTVITAAGAEASLVGRTLAQLRSVKAALDNTAKRSAGAPVWFVDERSNTVVVQALDRTAGEAFVAASGVDRAAVRIETITERPVPHVALRGGDPYSINNRPACSIGFSITRGATPGFVTAGHCGTAGTSTTGHDGTGQGTFQASSYPGNDFAWVAVNTRWTARHVVNAYAEGLLPVAGSAEAPVGTIVCRSGTTTQWRCGTILQRDVAVTYPGGLVVTQLVRTSACSDFGDSGGPVLAGFQAQGVMSGGAGDCFSSGSTSLFQPLNEILNTYGLTLVTTTVQCTGHPRRFLAEMTGSQGSFGLVYPVTGVHPSGTGFTTTATGAFSACLEGPGTSAMRLSLQRYNCCNGPFGIPTWNDVVATGTGSTIKTLTTTQGPGTYRWAVSATGPVVGPPVSEYYLLGVTNPA